MAWSLQDAKDRFSEVVNRAQAGEPQLVTRHGKRAVYVVDAAAFDAARRKGAEQESDAFARHLLAIPTGGPDDLFGPSSHLTREDDLFAPQPGDAPR